MKKVTSDSPITFSITSARVLDLTPDEAVLVSDAEAQVLVERLGVHVTVVEASPEDVESNISDQQKADEEVTPPAKAGDPCVMSDGSGAAGVLVDTSEAQDGSALVCQLPGSENDESDKTETPVLGGTCTLEDGQEGEYLDDPANPGNLICTAKEA